MLNPHDVTVVARDPDLPGLRFLLDDDAALELLQEHCPHLKPSAVRCTYLRYKPHTSCLAAYTVTTTEGEQLFYAKTYPLSNSGKMEKILGRETNQATCRPSTFEAPGLATVFSAFPYDDELPALRLLTDAVLGKPLLTRIVPERTQLHAARMVPLRYKPERRFVARLDVNDQPSAVLKIHSESRYQQARRATKSLGSLYDVEIAKTIGHSDRHCSLLLSWRTGSNLSTNMELGQAIAASFESAGTMLGKLHRQPMVKIPRRSTQYEIQEIQQQSQEFSYVEDAISTRLKRLTSQCADAIAGAVFQPVPTHGDFHSGQLLVEDGNASIIDLDDVALGNAAYDLGNFLAHLERACLQGTLRESEKQQFAEALLDGYESDASDLIDHRLVKCYTASGLVRLVHEPFRHRASDWQDQQERILACVEKILGELASTQSVRAPISSNREISLEDVEVVDRVHARNDERLPYLSEAMNPALAQEAIGPLASELYGDQPRLRGIRVFRHKPGRRCIVAYEFLTGRDLRPITLLGKTHVKNRHNRSFLFQQSLWNNGFDDQSDDGISVTRPVGVVPQWNMWLQEFIPGKNGWEALLEPDSDSATQLIADAVCKLHQANLPAARTHTLEDEVEILEDRLRQVALSLPHLALRINSVLEGCRDLASTISESQSTGIHRDFYPDQVLFSNDRIYLLDLDLYCHGHSSLDIGNFCAHLQEHAIRHECDRGVLETAEQLIRRRYLTRSTESCRTELDALTTISLARHIYLSTKFKSRQFATLPIISTCEQRLSAIGVGADRT